MSEINRGNLKDKIKFINNHDGEKLQEGDDIRQEDLITIGSFLKCITQQNEFSIKEGSEKVKLKGSDGRPADIKTGGTGAETFTNNNDAHLEQISNSGDFPDFPRKGIDGHDFLRKVEGRPVDTTGKVQIKSKDDIFKTNQRISNVLKKNRFNTEERTPFVPRGSTSADIDNLNFARVQKSFGEYDRKDANVNFEELKKVGLSLMLKATGEFFGDGDPTNIEAGASSLVPGVAQFGATQIDPKSMYAENVFGGEKFRKEELISLEQDSTFKGSYGSLNNFQEPFGGLHPTGMIVLANGLVLALKGILEAFARILGLGSSEENISNERGPFPIGRSKNNNRSALGRFSFADLGINNTKNKFSQALDRGIDVFFSAGALGNDFKRVAESPGFYAVLVRSIIRSTNSIIGESLELENISGNVFTIAQNVAGVLSSLKNSKIISIINVLAQLGDNAIELEKQGFLSSGFLGELETGNLPTKISTVDALPENSATRVMKSRVSSNNLTLAWRNSSSPSAYVLPVNILVGETSMPNENNKSSNILSVESNVFVREKISNETVKELEDELDAEYVPFYFHDLRTNEIISFHAFLASLTDNFNANWESSSPYGRIDPVRIYKNTERAINFDFHVVSTNEHDFDEMWFKINKLVNMVYPSWSKGRKLNVNEDTFIQPFSQIPTASPIIRLRIGDVIKSNYSRFGLARLFGLGTRDFKVKNQEVSEEISSKKKKIFKVIKRMETQPSGPNDENAGFRVGEQAFLRTSNKGYHPVGGGKKLVVNFQPTVTVKNISFDFDFNVVYSVVLDEPERFGIIDFTGKQFLVNFNDLELFVPGAIRSALGNEEIPDEEINSVEAISNFFNPDENAIVRSFESTSGKGLAGAIGSINFDWKEPTWSVERHGSRAPQWCKVSLQFMPIHDLPIGIHNGQMNGIYNVGQIMNGVMSSPYENDEGKKRFEEKHAELPKFLRPEE